MCLRISPPCGADNSTCLTDLSGPASPASLLATSTNIAFLAVHGKSWNDEKEENARGYRSATRDENANQLASRITRLLP
jgi:hypothetical protein